MPSANKKYVVIKHGGADGIKIYGSRFGQPFDTEVNAQRSLTRRKGKTRGAEWAVVEIQR